MIWAGSPVVGEQMHVVNAALSAFITICVVLLLIRYIQSYNPAERLGHGLAGAASFISIFKQLGLAALIAPYNDGYQLFWRVGWALLVGGKLWRLEQHRRRNKEAVAQAERHLSDRWVI